ncbi:hypothetical protein PWT90_07668 [Aphanocladium album]|nr:hypothetical protein PWT90_07668 [Aphanocladium album]
MAYIFQPPIFATAAARPATVLIPQQQQRVLYAVQPATLVGVPIVVPPPTTFVTQQQQAPPLVLAAPVYTRALPEPPQRHPISMRIVLFVVEEDTPAAATTTCILHDVHYASAPADMARIRADVGGVLSQHGVWAGGEADAEARVKMHGVLKVTSGSAAPGVQVVGEGRRRVVLFQPVVWESTAAPAEESEEMIRERMCEAARMGDWLVFVLCLPRAAPAAAASVRELPPPPPPPASEAGSVRPATSRALGAHGSSSSRAASEPAAEDGNVSLLPLKPSHDDDDDDDDDDDWLTRCFFFFAGRSVTAPPPSIMEEHHPDDEASRTGRGESAAAGDQLEREAATADDGTVSAPAAPSVRAETVRQDGPAGSTSNHSPVVSRAPSVAGGGGGEQRELSRNVASIPPSVRDS